MKHFFFSLVASLSVSAAALAQAPSGPVAHWPMNGNPNDTSGNGHHGTLNNVTLTTGRDGVANTAYFFSGAASYISVPYSAAWNVAQYTIGAVVKPTTFNTAPCQGNYVVARGPQNGGRWSMSYTDNGPTNDCNDVDTSGFYFQSYPGMAINPVGSSSYSPAITTNQWYTVICTYDGYAAKTYVNGQLKSTVIYSGGIQTSFSGVTIGREDPSPSAQYPFPFIGVIDDLRFYNRVLSNGEITGYGIPVPADVQEAKIKLDVQVSPNPAADYVDVQLGITPATATDVELFSTMGQLVRKSRFDGAGTRVALTDLAPGIYSLRLSSGAGTLVRQVVKR